MLRLIELHMHKYIDYTAFRVKRQHGWASFSIDFMLVMDTTKVAILTLTIFPQEKFAGDFQEE